MVLVLLLGIAYGVWMVVAVATASSY
jgi:hypothetical protein